MSKPIRIVGAGLAGLIAACHFKNSTILEAGKLKENHKALLRFRDKSVSELTGIPFKEVTVDKAIYTHEGLVSSCSIQLANKYSRKVTGTLSGRSIWNLERAQRFIAPDDFYGQLVDRHHSRIIEDARVNFIEESDKDKITTISTAPLPIMLAATGIDTASLTMERAAIQVTRFRVPNCDVYQTIYFPESNVRVFRASITGNMLIIESMNGEALPKATRMPMDELQTILHAFGISDTIDDLVLMESVQQQYGKIVPMATEARHAVLYELTERFGVYSLGRFATWRNILLDDVANDIKTVDRLIKASSYGRLHALRGAEA